MIVRFQFRATGSVPASGACDHVLLKVNAAGAMPIIFAQAHMFQSVKMAQHLNSCHPFSALSSARAVATVRVTLTGSIFLGLITVIPACAVAAGVNTC